MSDAARGWRVVVPVKGAPLGKSRLAVASRDRLARAFALDSIDAVLEAIGPAGLVVVTGDEQVGPYAEAAGALVLPDPGTGLNDAIRAGLAADSPPPMRAALLGDLPALTAADLLSALEVCGGLPRAVVPDHQGFGTVLLTAVGADLAPSFGDGSAARHEAAGHTRLDLDLPRLRTDVDVRDDLATVLALGCGRHTAAVLADATGLL